MSITPKAFVNEIMKQIITNQLGGHISYENENGFIFENNVYGFLYMRFIEDANKIEYCLPRPMAGYYEDSYDLNNFNLNDAMQFFGDLLGVNIANIVYSNEANVNLNMANGNQQQEL